MDNFNLAKALREYRTKHGRTHQQMANKLAVSRQAYDRLEDGITKPTYEQVQYIRKILDLYEPVKWYRSGYMRWVYPVVISFVFFSLSEESIYFREAYGGEEHIREHSPTRVSIISGAIFCAIFWYYWPPKWPFK